MTISVIIPTLNEGQHLGKLLSRLTTDPLVHEVVVCDGGSEDDTAAVAAQFDVRFVSAQKQRAKQLNYGARFAGGDVLFFLHADVRLADDALEQIRECLKRHDAGCFRLHFDHPHWALDFSGRMTRFQNPYIHYGDSGYFIKKSLFDALGGFKEMPILEDLEFWLRLRKKTTPVVLDSPITVSARRFLRYGVVREQLLSVLVVLLYVLRVRIDWIERVYTLNKKRRAATPNLTLKRLRYAIAYLPVTLYHWTYSNLHLALQTYYILKFMWEPKIKNNMLPDDHPWLTGKIPGSENYIWPQNIVYASEHASEAGDSDETIVTKIGLFLSGMVKKSNQTDGEIPQGPRRRMPHAVNLLHGSIHYNGCFIIFSNIQDAMRHLSDSRFLRDLKKFARREKREAIFVLRDRTTDAEEYAWFVGFVRAHLPWYANGNGPNGKRVLYGTPSPYHAVNPINGSWVLDVNLLVKNRQDLMVKPPLADKTYFSHRYHGVRREFTFLERFHVWVQHLGIRLKGFQGNLVFSSRRKIEPENLKKYQKSNGQWSASYPVSHPFMPIEAARKLRRKQAEATA